MSKIRLMLGDCLERIKEIPDGSIDMVLADPAYGVTAFEWDSIIDFKKMWESFDRIIKNNGVVVLFGTEIFSSKIRLSNISLYKYDWVWLKNRPTGMLHASYRPMKYHEYIHVFSYGKSKFNKQLVEREGKGKNCYKYEHSCGESNHVKLNKIKKFYNHKLVNPSSVLLFNSVSNRKCKLHPTQKPVPLMEYLIKTYTDKGETVLDFVMGSGTTGVACKKLNRKFIGIEKDKKYFKIAKARILRGG